MIFKYTTKDIVEFIYVQHTYQINIAIKGRFKVINLHHEKKFIKFCKKQKIRICKDPEILKRIVHNFSPDALTAEEMNALSYGLDHHIPTKADRKTIRTEFEQFFQNLLKDISHIPENAVGQIKAKLRNTCEKYCNVKFQTTKRALLIICLNVKNYHHEVGQG